MSGACGTEGAFSEGGLVALRTRCSVVAAQVRAGRDAGFPVARAETELVRLLTPRVRTEAVRWVRAGTSLQVDDLVQVGLMAALRCVCRYELSTSDFEPFVHREVRRSLRDYARLHSHDVRPSYDAQRGRTAGGASRCSVVSWDDLPTTEREDGEHSRESALPEEALAANQERARLLRLVATLPQEERHLVERRFGLGRYDAASSRELARFAGVSRTVTDGVIAGALATLRAVLQDDDADYRGA